MIRIHEPVGVTCQEPNDRGNLAAGYITVQPSEAAARQVFADKARVAEALDYACVELRFDAIEPLRVPASGADEFEPAALRHRGRKRAAGHTAHRGEHDAMLDAEHRRQRCA